MGKNVWAEKNVFGLKRELFWAEKNVFWAEKKGTRELKRKERQKDKETKGGSAETEKGRNRKRKRTAALKLKEREGWNREFFSIYFPSNLLRKIMVNSFMLDLIFSMN